jgi:hypothetical protein
MGSVSSSYDLGIEKVSLQNSIFVAANAHFKFNELIRLELEKNSKYLTLVGERQS